jgi:hypothetical protein
MLFLSYHISWECGPPVSGCSVILRTLWVSVSLPSPLLGELCEAMSSRRIPGIFPRLLHLSMWIVRVLVSNIPRFTPTQQNLADKPICLLLSETISTFRRNALKNSHNSCTHFPTFVAQPGQLSCSHEMVIQLFVFITLKRKLFWKVSLLLLLI